MSELMQMMDRRGLMQVSRSPLAMGRRVLSAQALFELAWRCFYQYTRGGGLARSMRVAAVITGRRRQVIVFLEGLSPVETARAFTGVLDAFSQLQANAAAACAAAAIDEVLNGKL